MYVVVYGIRKSNYAAAAPFSSVRIRGKKVEEGQNWHRLPGHARTQIVITHLCPGSKRRAEENYLVITTVGSGSFSHTEEAR